MNNFKEPAALNAVANFHKTFGAPVVKAPKIPAKERAQLRINLLQEELDELKAAIAENNLVEVADALCDIQYVLSGAVLEFGMAQKFKDLFNEVQRSNMSKACKTVKEAEETVAHFSAKGQVCQYKKMDDNYIVYRIEDNKVLKSINYSPADLKGILKT